MFPVVNEYQISGSITCCELTCKRGSPHIKKPDSLRSISFKSTYWGEEFITKLNEKIYVLGGKLLLSVEEKVNSLDLLSLCV